VYPTAQIINTAHNAMKYHLSFISLSFSLLFRPSWRRSIPTRVWRMHAEYPCGANPDAEKHVGHLREADASRVTFNDRIDVIAKPTDRQPTTSAA
jgi:hypothetical protein